jgi:hypothetical protein
MVPSGAPHEAVPRERGNMRKVRGCAIGLIALGFVFVSAAVADTLHLKDGRVLQGRYLGGTQVSLRFEINGEVKTFAVADVASITFTPGAAPTSAAPDATQGAEPSAPASNPPDTTTAATPPDASAANNSEPPVVSRDTVPPNANPPNNAAPVPPSPPIAPQSAPATNPTPSSGPPAQPGPAPGASAQVTLPAGQSLLVRMIDGVDSSKNQIGDAFRASLETDLYLGGVFVARKGTDVYGKLADAQQAGKMTGRSELQLQLTKIVIDGRDYPLVSSDYTVKGQSRNADTAKKVGGGAIIGAIIGGIVGGGKGAAIGAGAGAGTGAAAEVLTRGDKVRVPSETLLEFRLEQPAVVVPTQR